MARGEMGLSHNNHETVLWRLPKKLKHVCKNCFTVQNVHASDWKEKKEHQTCSKSPRELALCLHAYECESFARVCVCVSSSKSFGEVRIFLCFLSFLSTWKHKHQAFLYAKRASWIMFYLYCFVCTCFKKKNKRTCVSHDLDRSHYFYIRVRPGRQQVHSG